MLAQSAFTVLLESSFRRAAARSRPSHAWRRPRAARCWCVPSGKQVGGLKRYRSVAVSQAGRRLLCNSGRPRRAGGCQTPAAASDGRRRDTWLRRGLSADVGDISRMICRKDPPASKSCAAHPSCAARHRAHQPARRRCNHPTSPAPRRNCTAVLLYTCATILPGP
jgi:hypothetical protein